MIGTKRRLKRFGRASDLLRILEREGAKFTLTDVGAAAATNVPEEFAPAVEQNLYGLYWLLRDRQAAIDWEGDRACHCLARRGGLAHSLHRPREGETCWNMLKRVIAGDMP
jgi:hypothetical protein